MSRYGRTLCDRHWQSAIGAEDSRYLPAAQDGPRCGTLQVRESGHFVYPAGSEEVRQIVRRGSIVRPEVEKLLVQGVAVLARKPGAKIPAGGAQPLRPGITHIEAEVI